ncbi:MAG: Mpo1-like protein, partial [Pyrinomonadaceae bacterium]
PASFKHPLWSLAGDYKMVALMLAGRMGEEVARAHAGEAARGEGARG